MVLTSDGGAHAYLTSGRVRIRTWNHTASRVHLPPAGEVLRIQSSYFLGFAKP